MSPQRLLSYYRDDYNLVCFLGQQNSRLIIKHNKYLNVEMFMIKLGLIIRRFVSIKTVPKSKSIEERILQKNASLDI